VSALEQEILERVRNLAPAKQLRVLDFLNELEHHRPLTARELMALPPAEREHYVKAAIATAAEEDFETFEAYTEELTHDE